MSTPAPTGLPSPNAPAAERAAQWSEIVGQLARRAEGRNLIGNMLCRGSYLDRLAPDTTAGSRERVTLRGVIGFAVALHEAGRAARVDAIRHPDAGSRGPGVRLLRRAVVLAGAGLVSEMGTDAELLAALADVMNAPAAGRSFARVCQELLAPSAAGTVAAKRERIPSKSRQQDIVRAILDAGERLQRNGIKTALRMKNLGTLAHDLRWMATNDKLSSTSEGYWPVGEPEPGVTSRPVK